MSATLMTLGLAEELMSMVLGTKLERETALAGAAGNTLHYRRALQRQHRAHSRIPPTSCVLV